MNEAKTEAIAQADAYTNDAGLPTYSELLALLREARRTTMGFYKGNCFMRAAYIAEQDDLKSRIDTKLAALKAAA